MGNSAPSLRVVVLPSTIQGVADKKAKSPQT